MKALSLILLVMSAFVFWLGYSAGYGQSRVLGRTLMAGSTLAVAGVIIVWILNWKKEKKEKNGPTDNRSDREDF